MILSKKTRYAMLALTKLAREYGRGAILISEIARSENIPQRFLENILQEMKKLGIVGSRQGKTGGYFLLQEPEKIKMVTVIRHFEGTIAMMYCVSEKAYQPCEFCKDEATCKIRNVFKRIRDNTYGILEETSLGSLI
ncbi:MAG: Rrf2 family transcriptional regulator [Bacteroidetes bacterium]|nr:Rrf2 family transcriptional regulator [Bacteroidota bacterium]